MTMVFLVALSATQYMDLSVHPTVTFDDQRSDIEGQGTDECNGQLGVGQISKGEEQTSVTEECNGQPGRGQRALRYIMLR